METMEHRVINFVKTVKSIFLTTPYNIFQYMLMKMLKMIDSLRALLLQHTVLENGASSAR